MRHLFRHPPQLRDWIALASLTLGWAALVALILMH